ncbi:hypothetical protein M5D96_008443 [Drosophila gunungcola]|uniref:Peptidase S1 domain-containing protein n=1 Tax=Drosophila gunungcola TaxID=103775 RepID=A0A9P9YKH5_9MUSC|nr:hypothetical protein M5D96_008443 [Drosophila gunungcola]
MPSFHCRVVYLGEFDRSTITDCSTTACMPNAIGIPVDAQIAHPRYVHHSQNDIALFRLATPVQYSGELMASPARTSVPTGSPTAAYIKPICLLTNYNPLAHIRLLTAIGWGTTEHGVPSNVLKTTTLTQVDRSHCSATYGSVVDMSHICAGDRTSHTCMGDSGGPIFATLPIGSTSRVVQMGIVSYGDSECRRWGVYTNVMHHMNWILQVVRQGGPQVPQRPLPPQGSYYVYVPWYAVG